ncbi:MAG: cyclic pyranopterin monophosphate synthase MoaC [Deltaproteobacteria bacterium]|nr:cyclic pyranopterin monophosphate synthase MoaC [Deltaproteobacteria bacterium]
MYTSTFHMIDVGEKIATQRRAVATGRILMSLETLNKIKNKQMPKGDVLAMAEVAGIMAAKKTPELLPLCHPLAIDSVNISCEFNEQSEQNRAFIRVNAEVKCTSKTGVEMEALVAVQTALLAIYDLTKGVDPELYISDVYLKTKEGGKSGKWIHPIENEKLTENILPKPNQLLQNIRASVLTISDRCFAGEQEDVSGVKIKEFLTQHGAICVDSELVPDEKEKIVHAILYFCKELKADLIFSNGLEILLPVLPHALHVLNDGGH